MLDDKKSLERLINEYLHGTITPEEKRHLEKWMERLDISDEQLSVNEFHKIIMKKQIDLRTGAPEKTVSLRRRKLWWPIAAASLLFTLTIGTYLWQSNQADIENQQASTIDQTPDLFELTNNSDRDTLLSLKDGSQVLLSSGSTLTWPIDFASDARQLTLDGKAFFRVAKDADRPFSVYAGNIITTALGTSFWIEKMKGNLSPTVKLVTGKVSINLRMIDGRDSLLAMLTPGQEWNLTKPQTPIRSNTKNKLKEKNPIPDAADLVFHHAPLKDVFPRLASYYNVTIKFDFHELEGMSFYGTFDGSNHIQEIIQTIALANDLIVEYNEEEATYTIKK
ncbi:MAG TPA: FecR domain-containing protein [Sphingobacterium sp.]|nr:FecR domain-containing protein [Sphingobacterium sp.]